jgi:hypothetical protein
MCIMAPEPILTVYFINPSHQSVCLCECIALTIARHLLGKLVSAATNTRKNRRIDGRVVFYPVSVIPKESLRVCVHPYRC